MEEFTSLILINQEFCIKFDEHVIFFDLGFPEINIGVAEGGEENLDSDLHFLRRRHLHFLNHQRLPRLPRHRSYPTINFHIKLLKKNPTKIKINEIPLPHNQPNKYPIHV